MDQQMLTHVEGQFEARPGVMLNEQWWLPAGVVKGLVVIAHGIAEHSGRYAHVAEYFGRHGYAVGSFDLEGHGKSTGKRAYIQSFDHLLDDLELFLARARARAGEKPLFLLGHSLGSGMVAWFMIDRSLAGVRGALLSGSLVTMGSSVPVWMVKAVKVLGALTPNLPLLKIDHSTISRDQAVMDSYDNDPLNYRGKVLARTGDQINRALQYVQANMPRIQLPLLIVQGAQDRLVDPAGSRLLYEKAGSTDKTLKIYEGLYHEILNEPEKEQVMDDMLAWMDARL